VADLEVGQQAPIFSASTQDGSVVTLESLKGKVVVLYFYPKDDTPGCTKEACGFRDMNAEFATLGAVVYGVSRDSIESHKAFASKFQLTFPLLADPDEAICQAYGVIKEKTLYGKKSIGLVRTTFIIDQEGTIRKIFPNVRVDGHVDKVLDAVKQLNG
jgi:thioredoxin-dependent peroxiredoxin